MFAVFDENMSWYLDDNIRHRCDYSKVHKADPDFYKSNVMHCMLELETNPKTNISYSICGQICNTFATA